MNGSGPNRSNEASANGAGRSGYTQTGISAFDTQEGGDHYRTGGIQPTQYILANGLGFIEGNVVKYVTRYKAKGGVQDLRKARHYLDMLIEYESA